MNKLNSDSSVFSSGWIDLIFENLNQRYGAYAIRSIHRHLLGKAIMITISVIAGILITFNLSRMVGLAVNPVAELIPDGVFNLNEPPLPAVVLPPAPNQAEAATPKVAPGMLPKIVPYVPDPSNEPAYTDPGFAAAVIDSAGPAHTALPAGGTATTNPGTGITDTDNTVHLIVEVAPAFPGGEQELIRYLKRHIRYPEVARSKGVGGIVYVTFTITKDGTVSDVVLNQGIGSGCDEEAIRVINAMPKWKPGKQSGMPVSVRFNLPIRFAIK